MALKIIRSMENKRNSKFILYLQNLVDITALPSRIYLLANFANLKIIFTMKFRVAVSIAVAENMTVVLNEISMVVVFC
jgi:hypothetical protein